MIKRVLLTLLIAGTCQFMEKANAQGFIVNSSGQTQQNSNLSKRYARKRLKVALRDIEARFGVQIVYKTNDIPDQIISLDTHSDTLEEVLESALSSTDITYKKVYNTYILSKKEISRKLTEWSVAPVNSIPSDKLATIGMFQEIIVSGKVTGENGQDFSGVTVLVKGTGESTTTDGKGSYKISVPDDKAVLVFSYIGFQEIVVGNRTILDVSLKNESKVLGEVLIAGYGETTKSDITGSVVSIKGDDLNAYPTTNLMQSLSGRVAGVQISQNSGEPGGAVSVRIRGMNSIQGSNEPLYVVDGFALSGAPTAISPNDIESMEILKDASATAIYGSRGANGVVMITTKQGKSGKTKVSLDSYYAVQQVNKKIDLMNAQQFAMLANERATNDGIPAYFTPEQISSFGDGTDWQDVLFRTAPMQNHTLAVAGGNDNTQYSVSGNYFGQEGIIRGSNYQRESFRVNLSQKLGEKVRLSYNSVLSNTDRTQLPDEGQKSPTAVVGRANTVMFHALGASPTISPFDNTGKYSFIKPYPFSPNILENPLAMAEARKQKINEVYILANAAVSYQPVKNLTLRSSIGIENSSSRGDLFSPSVITSSPTGTANISYTSRFNFLNENTATYIPKMPDGHNVTLLGGLPINWKSGDRLRQQAQVSITKGLKLKIWGWAAIPVYPPAQPINGNYFPIWHGLIMNIKTDTFLRLV